MALDGRTPVLVGAAVVQQREEDPGQAAPALGLMARALEAAALDSGVPALLAKADSIRTPRGFWTYGDPGRFLAERFGASARTQLAEVGVLQTTLFGRAAADIASGACDLVLLTGAEAKYRSLRAQILGIECQDTEAPGEADEVLRPAAEIMSPLEIQHGLGIPVNQYAMIDNALRAAEGQSVEAHRNDLAALWAGMNDVAVANPDAWNRQPVGADAIRGPGDRNRMLAFPYTKLHTSQWNVDQAAGLILSSLERARALGLADDRLVFPLSVADSNFMIALCERRALHQSPGFRHAGRAACESAGLEPSDVAHRELYSCFPSAVRVQQRELDLDRSLPVTVTGGMTFAGGPLNNFVIQALAKMVVVLRAHPGDVGMVNAVSGLLTKQGVSLWSTRPPERPFAHRDVSAETEADSGRVEVLADATGDGTIATYTVSYEGDAPTRAGLIVDLDDGRRTVTSSREQEIANALVASEGCGRAVSLGDGVVRLS